MIEKIGFMQGRLSPIVNGKIQAFPWHTWQQEIKVAKNIDINIMEWTLDQECLYDNPLMTESGQTEIMSICNQYAFSIPSLTGDCFMQAPFWKASNNDQCDRLKCDFKAIAESCGKIGIEFIVVPLVDGGCLENAQQENSLVEFLLEEENRFREIDVRVIFESDFHPLELKRFISRLPFGTFGINYDTGNSASLGLNPFEEFEAFGDRILNVHLKDRILGGASVPIGQGNVDFNNVFSLLESCHYDANYILQTARARDGQHAKLLSKYKKYFQNWNN